MMKWINRQAYGFRSFENYRLRDAVLCSKMSFGLGSAHVLSGEPILCNLFLAERQGFEPWVQV